MAHTSYQKARGRDEMEGEQTARQENKVDVVFYKDNKDPEKPVLKPDLFSKIAEELAGRLAKAGRNSNKRSQIRKFYDEVLRLNALSKANPDDWEYILPYVNMLIAKASYAYGRNTLVNEDFLNFMKEAISQVHYPRDLDVFANFFEAFMGFYRKERQD
jgi:CRISPR-associated protein Csm2